MCPNCAPLDGCLWLCAAAMRRKETFFSRLVLLGRRQWQPTPVLLPRKSHERRSLVGCSPWVANSRTWLSDFTFTFHFHALEKEMATHSSVLAWRIPGMGEPGMLPSMGSHRVGHGWSDLAAAAAVLLEYFWRISAVHSYFLFALLLQKGSIPWDYSYFIPIHFVLLLLYRSRVKPHRKFSIGIKICDAVHTQMWKVYCLCDVAFWAEQGLRSKGRRLTWGVYSR